MGIRATIFAVTGWLGDGAPRAGERVCPDHASCMASIRAGRADEVMLRWSEIEEMEASGLVECHSHTHTHTRWDREPMEPSARLQALADDLSLSRETLARRLGRQDRHLCWPQGYFDAGYVGVARKLGFEALYTTRKHVNMRGTPPDDIGRLVTKERAGAWLGNRLAIYANPLLGRLYTALRGK
jgi:peptidoglycan/xylan/chitin deacetylase (PgdA/CDA1 family)